MSNIPDENLRNYEVDLKNIMGDKQVQERTREISEYIQLLSGVAQLARTKIIDPTPIIAELGSMYSMAGSSTEVFINELNHISAEISRASAENLQQNNTTT